MATKRIVSIITLIILCFFVYVKNSYSSNEDSTIYSLFNKPIEYLVNQEVNIATKFSQNVFESPSVVSVITSEDIKNMGARELADVLRIIPGFEVIRSNPGYYSIGVRGVKNSRISSKLLFMLDGIPLNQIFYGNFVNWGYVINMDNVDKIEIIRGPGSALYGRNAFSAVINIITKTAETGEKLKIKGSAGTFNTYSLSGLYSYKKKDFSSTISIYKINSDVADSDYDEGFGPTKWNIYRNNLNTSAKIGYKNLTLSANYLNQQGGGLFTDSKISNEIFLYSLNYKKQLNSKISINSTFYGRNSEYVEDIEDLKPNTKILLPGMDSLTYADVYPLGIYYKPHSNGYIYNLESELDLQLHDNNSLLLGIQANIYGVKDVTISSNIDFATNSPLPGIGRDNQVLYKPGWFENGEHDYTNVAFLLQDIWYPHEKIGITLGGRYDIDSEIGGVICPRGGIVVEPLNNLNIKFLYGRAYRAPAPADQYVTLGYAIGNKNLKPEIINNYEISVNYHMNSISHSVSIYRNKLKDMIYTALLTSIDPRNVYYNVGKNTSSGIEYEGKIYLGNKYYGYFNYAYTNSINKDRLDDGTDTIYHHLDISPHKINMGANILFLKYFKLNIHSYYRSKVKKFTILGSNPPMKVQNNIGNYFVWNSTLQIENMVKNMKFSVSVYNILDNKYYSQDNQNILQPAQPGRQILGTISYSIQ